MKEKLHQPVSHVILGQVSLLPIAKAPMTLAGWGYPASPDLKLFCPQLNA